jgi:hypothetical protein
MLRVMREEDFLGSNRQTWNKPAKNHCRRDAPKELSDYKPRNIKGPNARECITEASRNCDRRVGKRCRCCEPVGRRDVGTYSERNSISSKSGTTPNYGDQAKRRYELTENLGLSTPNVTR